MIKELNLNIYFIYNKKMKISIFGFDTTLYKWEVKNPKAIMQIVHGSAEHAKRYESFAKYLNTQGISVWAMDLMGHGKEESIKDNLGYLGRKGYETVIEHVNKLGDMMKEEFPEIPYVLLGHSMGSFIARTVAIKHNNIDFLIAIGTNHQNRIKSLFNYILAATSTIFFGRKHKAWFLSKLSYETFDKKLNSHERGEWISKNKSNRNKFLNDPLCDFTFTNNGFKHMAHWINTINSTRLIKKQNKNMKVLFLAGREDIVGNMTKEVTKAYDNFIKAGLHPKINLYDNMRHEILNEKNNLEVYQDIIRFILVK